MYHKVTPDLKTKLYTIQIDKNACTTAEFHYIHDRSKKVMEWIDEQGYSPAFTTLEYGTEIAYQQYTSLMKQAETICAIHRIQCRIELIPELAGFENKFVEVTGMDGEKQRFWVGRSRGWMPCHIARLRSNSSGGLAVMGAPFKSVTVIRES